MRRARVRTPQTPPGHLPRYRARILDDRRHDPYQPRGKQASAQCSECGAVFREGRWQWSQGGVSAGSALCPACKRMRDKLPAGRVRLEGPLVAAQTDELLRIAYNEAEHEKAEHPLHRIMEVASGADRLELSTTDIHLPQRIGKALKRAHGGKLTVKYARDDYGVLVRWQV